MRRSKELSAGVSHVPQCGCVQLFDFLPVRKGQEPRGFRGARGKPAARKGEERRQARKIRRSTTPRGPYSLKAGKTNPVSHGQCVSVHLLFNQNETNHANRHHDSLDRPRGRRVRAADGAGVKDKVGPPRRAANAPLLHTAARRGDPRRTFSISEPTAPTRNGARGGRSSASPLLPRFGPITRAAASVISLLMDRRKASRFFPSGGLRPLEPSALADGYVKPVLLFMATWTAP